MTAEPFLEPLNRLVGAWSTEARHPALPGVVVHGTVLVEWLEGERFLIHRARTDHPEFPDSISIIGCMARGRADEAAAVQSAADGNPPLSMHYFDSRGVFRVFDVSIDAAAWRFRREAPGFSQSFTGKFADGGDSIIGLSLLCQDDVHWIDDLEITYRRRQ